MSEKELRDMAAMQEEAKRRVMDMRSRSRFAAEQMNRSFGGPSSAPEENRSAQVPGHGPPAKDAPGMSGEDLERLLILSLCLLLEQEQADRSVILGLMYLLT